MCQTPGPRPSRGFDLSLHMAWHKRKPPRQREDSQGPSRERACSHVSRKRCRWSPTSQTARYCRALCSLSPSVFQIRPRSPSWPHFCAPARSPRRWPCPICTTILGLLRQGPLLLAVPPPPPLATPKGLSLFLFPSLSLSFTVIPSSERQSSQSEFQCPV